jgi:hypothetical protein
MRTIIFQLIEVETLLQQQHDGTQDTHVLQKSLVHDEKSQTLSIEEWTRFDEIWVNCLFMN